MKDSAKEIKLQDGVFYSIGIKEEDIKGWVYPSNLYSVEEKVLTLIDVFNYHYYTKGLFQGDTLQFARASVIDGVENDETRELVTELYLKMSQVAKSRDAIRGFVTETLHIGYLTCMYATMKRTIDGVSADDVIVKMTPFKRSKDLFNSYNSNYRFLRKECLTLVRLVREANNIAYRIIMKNKRLKGEKS